VIRRFGGNNRLRRTTPERPESPRRRERQRDQYGGACRIVQK